MVNPAIGTTQTKTHTLWGGEGGTYPGAVAPFGFMQLTPETRVAEPGGYDYKDSTIYYFSCTHHLSGYPNGSSGNIQVMPVQENREFQTGNYHRPFSHQDEKIEPGYYRVCFKDNHSLVEVTASEHAGMFRFTFPAHSRPRIFLGDMGTIEVRSGRIIEGSKLNAVVLLSKDFIEKEDVTGGCLLTFPSVDNEKNQLILKIGASVTDLNAAYKNLHSEAYTWNFDQYKKENQQKWVNALSVIEIDDTSNVNKTIFYTALYHSFLLPWIISDVDGFYKGADGLIHRSKGKNQYSAFSAWDTFRTLHPLLCLVAPGRQNEMIQSMLDQYVQSGRLPKGPMTGNHVIPIIVDSYLKGICNFDSSLAYKAMKSSLTPANNSDDFSAYRDLGYAPLSYSESVTRTVEYAYDDWDSKILDISTNGKLVGDTITDRSGLSNNGIIKKIVAINHLSGSILNDSVNFVGFNHSKSLDGLNHQVTIMGWVYPTKQKGISDIVTKGDHIVIQTHGNSRITFFAGGWGRGSCSANLPDDWLNNWHHITGTCDGNSLKLYIDGKESGNQVVASPTNLSAAACWMIGGNEEFPDQRFFHGLIDEVKIFAEPLTDPEINKEMQESNHSFKH